MRRPTRRLAPTALVLFAAIAVSCSAELSVERFDTTVAPVDRADPIPADPVPADPVPADPVPADPAPPRPEHDPDDEVLYELVDDVLLRYATALTAIARDPERFDATGTPERDLWDRVVVGGSWLSMSVSNELLLRQRQQHVVVVPDQGELSYRHYPVVVEPPQDGTISFTWCGWSPGLGIDTTTGEVVDDGVAHAGGTGQLRLEGGTWMLETLDALDHEVLPAGSPDPCAS